MGTRVSIPVHCSGTQRRHKGVDRPSLTHRVELTWQASMSTFDGNAPLAHLSGGDTLWWIPYGFSGDGKPRAVNSIEKRLPCRKVVPLGDRVE